MLIKYEVRELLAVWNISCELACVLLNFIELNILLLILFLVNVKNLQNAKWPKIGAMKSM